MILTHGLAFLSGTLGVQLLPELPRWWWFLVFLPLALLKHWRLGVHVLLAAALGAAWACYVATGVLGQRLDPNLEGQDLWVEGKVVSIPRYRKRSQRFDIRATKLFNKKGEYNPPEKIRLSLYAADFWPQPGEYWRFNVRLKRPHGFYNPGGFDYQGWLFAKRVGATGYVRKDSGNRRIQTAWAWDLSRIRWRLVQRIESRLQNDNTAGLVTALVTGYRGGISSSQWNLTMRTGVSHLLAISGLHIGLIAGAVFFLSRWLWSILGFGLLRLPAPQFAGLCSFSAAALYAAVAGFALPTQRALIMLAIVLSGLLWRRRISAGHWFGMALLAVLITDPIAVWSPGFWLSFGAVGVIALLVSGRRGPKHNRFLDILRIQWGISLGLLPLLLLLFQKVSLVGPVANLIAIPVVGFVVTPLAMIGGVLELVNPGLLSTALLNAAAWVLAKLWLLLELFGSWSWSQWQTPRLPLWSMVCASFGIVLIMALKGIPGRLLGLFWLLPLFLIEQQRPLPGLPRLALLDVGQGLAVVVETANHALIYDTGPRYSDQFDTGKAVIIPFLRQRGIDNVDKLVISHGDNDHIGGAVSVLEAFPMTPVLSSVPSKLSKAKHCQKGQTWTWDGVRFAFLAPSKSLQRYGHNDASCVLHVEGRCGSILLTGDIEALAEQYLVNVYGVGLASDVLVAPHHGSRSSSTASFLEAVKPQWVLIPSGYRSRYGHPHPQVLARYAQLGFGVLTSAKHGAIEVQWPDCRPKVMAYRQTHKRYWFD
ncbi:MAG TPA: DNA internalization-related competence protein ComEC/Rec2 [Acidiferrobacteraceae bacterium]|nr:DNA internalization-related competence protein ComEC/Rec2 [Acidiferrobacteraceae bacterium]